MVAKEKNITLKGSAASPGIAISKVFKLFGESVKVDSIIIPASETESEVTKFKSAVRKARGELRSLQSTVALRIGDESAKIFDAQQLMLEDPVLMEATIRRIEKEHRSADYAFFDVMQKYQETLRESSVEYFQSRISDLRDVEKRIIRHIQGDRSQQLKKLQGAAVLVARDINPSDAVILDRHKVHGFATDLGGRTAHAAIMARSMEIPAVVGLREICALSEHDDRIIVDGLEGKVIVRPDDRTIRHYRKLQERYYNYERKLVAIRDLPPVTMDGKEIELSANLEFTDELDSAKLHGARGIGLFRTDYIYLRRNDLPTEEEQLEEYTRVAQKISPDPVIIRTMDLGGDKQPTSIQVPREENPYLGWRAIRISLERREIFATQLRAILRASANTNVKILFPMISGIEEVRECKAVLASVMAELKSEKKAFDSDIEIGVMIEVPSAAMLADKIASEVDFLSIGTNDLIQYMLAVDRGNERIAYLYQHLHPAVLRMIQKIIHAGHQQGVWVGMCGEMASDPLATILLLGMELDEFSVTPAAVPEIKNIIRAVTYRETVKIARKAMEFDKPSEVETFMTKVMRKRFRDITP